jgi:hypothetical protein
MTRAVFAALAITVCCVHPACAEQKDKQPTLLQRLQGTWSRPNYGQVYVIKGTDFTQYSKKSPLKVAAKGKIVFPKGKDYAELRADNGYMLWLFSAGDDKIVSEDFKPNGELAGLGTLLYRQPEVE